MKKTYTLAFCTALLIALFGTGIVDAQVRNPDSKRTEKNKERVIKFAAERKYVSLKLRSATDFLRGWVYQVHDLDFVFTDESEGRDMSFSCSELEDVKSLGSLPFPRHVPWNQLQLRKDQSIVVNLSDGGFAEGRVVQMTPTAIEMKIENTSKTMSLNGTASIPASSVAHIWIESEHVKGRIIGTALGGGAGIIVGTLASMAEYRDPVPVPVAYGIVAAGFALGNLMGRAADRSHGNDQLIIIINP